MAPVFLSVQHPFPKQYQIHRKDVIMFMRFAVPVLLILLVISAVSVPLQADDKRMERMEIAMKAEAKAPAEAVKALPAPPASEAVTLADIPEEPAGLLSMIYQWEEGDLGAIRIMAADDAVPEKTLVAVIVTAP
jgi:hypothetical protein